MKNAVKKIISVMLVAVMLVSAAPLSGFALELGDVGWTSKYADKLGDVNTDGSITSADAYIVLRTALGFETLNEDQWMLADIDCDGNISAADARHIFRTAVKLEEEIPVETNIPTGLASCLSCSGHFNISFDESEIENDILTVNIRFSGLPRFVSGDFRIIYSSFGELISVNSNMKEDYGFEFISNNIEPGIILASTYRSNYEADRLPDEKINLVSLKFRLTTDQDMTINIVGQACFGTKIGDRCDVSVQMNQADARGEGFVYKGKCGSNIIWTLDKNGTLDISGSGAMPLSWYDNAPWIFFYSDIKNVIIEPGVTSIGEKAFYNCTNLQKIEIPYTVRNISSEAFYDSAALTDVYFTGSENQWKSISIDSENAYLKAAAVHFNSKMPVEKIMNYDS